MVVLGVYTPLLETTPSAQVDLLEDWFDLLNALYHDLTCRLFGQCTVARTSAPRSTRDLGAATKRHSLQNMTQSFHFCLHNLWWPVADLCEIQMFVRSYAAATLEPMAVGRTACVGSKTISEGAIHSQYG